MAGEISAMHEAFGRVLLKRYESVKQDWDITPHDKARIKQYLAHSPAAKNGSYPGSWPR